MERIRHPEIIPLELSDIWVDGVTLWKSIQGRGLSGALHQVIEALKPGGASSWKGPFPAEGPGHEAVNLRITSYFCQRKNS